MWCSCIFSELLHIIFSYTLWFKFPWWICKMKDQSTLKLVHISFSWDSFETFANFLTFVVWILNIAQNLIAFRQNNVHDIFCFDFQMTSVTLDLKSQPTISIFEENKKAQLICLKKWFKYTLSRQVLLSERGSVSHTWVFSWKFSHANLLIVLQIAKFTILSPISLYSFIFLLWLLTSWPFSVLANARKLLKARFIYICKEIFLHFVESLMKHRCKELNYLLIAVSPLFIIQE